MRRIKYIVFIVLACIITFSVYRIYVICKSKYEVHKTLNSERYLQMLSSFNDSEVDSNSIVFIGNSLIEGFDLSQFHNPKTINRGISGDFTEGVIKRIDGVIKKHPKKLFIEIGINDLIEKVSQNTMITNYETILKKITNTSPLTRIYIHSLLPTKLEGSLFTPASAVNTQVMEFNKLLQLLSQKYNCTYVDTWSHFATKDNSMNLALTTDGIHLTAEGYRIWVGVIKDLVNAESVTPPSI